MHVDYALQVSKVDKLLQISVLQVELEANQRHEAWALHPISVVCAWHVSGAQALLDHKHFESRAQWDSLVLFGQEIWHFETFHSHEVSAAQVVPSKWLAHESVLHSAPVHKQVVVDPHDVESEFLRQVSVAQAVPDQRHLLSALQSESDKWA